jgi:hypothetical protein
MITELARAPSDGKPPKFGKNEWQLVEQVQQWHHGAFILGKGFLFDGTTSGTASPTKGTRSSSNADPA